MVNKDSSMIGKKEIPIPSRSIRLDWPVGKSLRYGLQLDIESNEETNELKYEIEVTRLYDKETGNMVFQIQRVSDVYINEILPDLVFDKLAFIVGSVFYPLIIELDGRGEIYTIANHQDILLRWPSVKEQVYQDFEGVLTEDYLLKMESLLQSVDQTTIALKNYDWFLNVFFKPIYKNYEARLNQKETAWYYPVTVSSNQYYSVEETLQDFLNHFGAIEILHEAKLCPEDEEEMGLFEGNYTGRYILHPRLKHILVVFGEWQINDEIKSTTVKAKLFCLVPKGQDIDYDFAEDYRRSSGFIVSEEEKINSSKKQSVWSKLFN